MNKFTPPHKHFKVKAVIFCLASVFSYETFAAFTLSEDGTILNGTENFSNWWKPNVDNGNPINLKEVHISVDSSSQFAIGLGSTQRYLSENTDYFLVSNTADDKNGNHDAIRLDGQL